MVTKKLCNKCGINPRKTSKGGWATYCVSCASEATKLSRQRNKKHIKKMCCKCNVNKTASIRSKYCIICREESKINFKRKSRQKQKQVVNIRNKINGTNKRRYQKIKNDPNKKLCRDLRIRMNRALVGKFKSGSAVRDLGCSIQEFMQYLEFQFKPGMTWANRGINGWHIDHIKPLFSFNLSIREQFLQACHYTNLQPLWKDDNLSKGMKERLCD